MRNNGWIITYRHMYEMEMMQSMKHKSCFTNKHCCFSCPNAAADEFEERFDIPASDAGYERIESCKVCYLNTGECEDCLFQHSKDCPEVENDKR